MTTNESLRTSKRELSSEKILDKIDLKDDSEIIGYGNILSTKNVKEIGKTFKKIKRSRSINTASTNTTTESTSTTTESRPSYSRSGSHSNFDTSFGSKLSSRKSINMINFDKIKEVSSDLPAPVPVRNCYSQYVDLESNEEVNHNI